MGGPKHFQYKLTRAKLEQLVDDVVKKCKHPIEQAMKDCEDFGSDQVRFEYIKHKMACCSREFSAKLKKQETARKKELIKIIEIRVNITL